MSNDNLSERKQKILKAVVDEYIVSANPISSGEIQSKHFSEISSATIRNELSALEEMGYLIQPHVSAGRIPSKKAYSLYVERFVEKSPLTEDEVAFIEQSFHSRFDKVEDIVRQTAKVISDMTNYTSVIILSNIENVFLKEIKLVGLDEHSVLVVIITDSGVIRDKVINLTNPVDETYIKDANAMINKIFSGRSIGAIQQPDAMIDAELAEFKELYESVIEILKAYCKSENNVIMEGRSKFLQSSDQSRESTQDFLEVIDTNEKIVDMINDGAGIEYSVKIGKDEKGGIDKCAIVTAKYRYKGKEIGHAGVIGPERMNYGKVISILESVKKALNDIDGGDNE